MYLIALMIPGGTYAEPGAPEVTHLVIDDQNIKEIPQNISVPGFVVRGEVSSDLALGLWSDLCEYHVNKYFCNDSSPVF